MAAASERRPEQGTVRVTDRALLRFLERSGMLDVEQIRDRVAMSLERSRKAAECIGVANFKIVLDGLCYVVEEGILVTVHKTDRSRWWLR